MGVIYGEADIRARRVNARIEFLVRAQTLGVSRGDCLALTEERPDHPGAELMVWVAVKNQDGELSTLGLAPFGLPEARLSLGTKAGPEELEHGTDVLLTLGMTMMRQHRRVVDGFQIGQTWETRFDGEKMCVTSTVEKKPLWKRLFR